MTNAQKYEYAIAELHNSKPEPFNKEYDNEKIKIVQKIEKEFRNWQKTIDTKENEDKYSNQEWNKYMNHISGLIYLEKLKKTLEHSNEKNRHLNPDRIVNIDEEMIKWINKNNVHREEDGLIELTLEYVKETLSKYQGWKIDINIVLKEFDIEYWKKVEEQTLLKNLHFEESLKNYNLILKTIYTQENEEDIKQKFIISIEDIEVDDITSLSNPKIIEIQRIDYNINVTQYPQYYEIEGLNENNLLKVLEVIDSKNKILNRVRIDSNEEEQRIKLNNLIGNIKEKKKSISHTNKIKN
jgi:hypothetical protein